LFWKQIGHPNEADLIIIIIECQYYYN